MFSAISEYFRYLKWSDFISDYSIGIAAGVLIAILLRLLFFILFRRYLKRSRGINICGDHGDLFISSSAISDLVKSLEEDFDFIKINKVALWNHKSYFSLDVKIAFDMKGGNLPELTKEYQARILTELNEVFGIDCIKRVNVRASKAVPKSRNSRF